MCRCWLFDSCDLICLKVNFYPRDAMLARVLAMALCLFLSQVSVIQKRLVETGWFLAWELLSTYHTRCYKEIQAPSKIRVLPSRTLLQTLGLENFASVYRSSKHVIVSSRKLDAQSVVNWTVVGQIN